MINLVLKYRLKQVPILIAFFCFVLNVSAQQNDFGFWAGAEVEKKLNKRFDLGFELGHRLKQNLTQRDESLMGIGLSFSKKKFSATIGYRFTNENSLKRSFSLAHRFSGQVKYKVKIDRFTLDDRFRLQAQYSNINSSAKGFIPVTFIRNKINLAYNIKGWPIEPSISHELFFRVNNYTPKQFEKQRLVLSLNYKIKKNHEVEFSLIRQNGLNIPAPVRITILGLFYKMNI